PSYSAIRMKLGEVIVSATPSPAPNAFARCVLPAPTSPHRQMTSPARAALARARPRADVAPGPGLTKARCWSVATDMVDRAYLKGGSLDAVTLRRLTRGGGSCTL